MKSIIMPISLNKAIKLYADNLLTGSPAPLLYLKDGNYEFHKVDELDLMNDKMRCEDGYWDYFEYIMETECGDYKLFADWNSYYE